MVPTFELVLNELSLPALAPDIRTARERMRLLIQTVKSANQLCRSPGLRTYRGFSHADLAPGYPIAQWRNDPAVDEVVRLLFGSLVLGSPHIEELQDQELEDDSIWWEARYGGLSALGLGYAYAKDSLAISLPSQSDWDVPQVVIDYALIGEDNQPQEQREVQVYHACSTDHIREHEEWITRRVNEVQRLSIRDGRDMWRRRDTLFPRLEFCSEVEMQLANLPSGHPMLIPVYDRMLHLEKFCESWNSGPLDIRRLGNSSVEGEATRHQYPEGRAYRCADGDTKLFSCHLKLQHGWRIYFLSYEGPGRLSVGYVGEHLRTVRFPD